MSQCRPPLRPARDWCGRCAAQRRPRAFTLVELMMALSICTLIGVCVAMMVSSLSQGTAGEQDGRRFLVRMQAVEAQVDDLLHPARCFLAAGLDAQGNGYLVFWNDDSSVYTTPSFPATQLTRTQPAGKANNAVQPSELAMLQLENGELHYYRVAYRADLTTADRNAADTPYPGGTDYRAALENLKTLDVFQTRQAVPVILARNVASFTVTLDNPAPQQALLATLTITLRRQLSSAERPVGDPYVQRTTVLAIALRVPAPPRP